MRSVVIVLATLVLLGAGAAQSHAQAPAPKVTINGLVDFVTTAYKNLSYQANQDITNNREKNWYSRERGVFTLTGEVGRVKGVWAIELDFTNGAGNFNASSQPGSLSTVGVAASGTSANFDLDTDIQGAVETKWLYLETPITGPGSLLPFIPVNTVARMGAQPFRGHDYKPGVLATGDFPGVNLETRWAPNVRSTLSFVQISEQLDRFAAPNQKDSFAVVTSVEFELFKGLTIKPTYAYAFWDGGNCGTSNLGTPAYGGYNPNTNCPAVTPGSVAGPAGVGRDIRRHYFGGDIRWTSGPFSFQPTVLFLIGEQEVPRRGGGINDVDVRSFLVDMIGGFRAGPLLIEARAFWNPGVNANHDIQNQGGGTARRYDAINPGFSYLAGWSEIWRGNIDYSASLLVGRPSVTVRESQSYDKYGRIFFGLAADYSLTPALTFTAITNVSWTDKKVDTKGVLGSTGIVPSSNPFQGGLERYLGNEWLARLSYRFAPNIVFDVVGAVLVTGDALNIQRASGGCVTDGVPTCQSRNVWKGSARVRVTF
jgi:hypothetical protein